MSWLGWLKNVKLKPYVFTMPKRAAMPVHKVTRCGQALAFKHLDVEVNAVKVALIEAWKWPWRDRERFDGSIWDEVYHGISQHFSTISGCL